MMIRTIRYFNYAVTTVVTLLYFINSSSINPVSLTSMSTLRPNASALVGIDGREAGTAEILTALTGTTPKPSSSGVKLDAKLILPSGLPSFDYRGITHPVQPRWVPRSTKGNAHVINEEALVELALRDGWKVVMTKNYDTMTYGSLYVIVSLLEMADRTYSLGEATGGTTEALRKAKGLVEYSKRILDGLYLNLDKINKFSTLDDYYWPKGSHKDSMETSSYRKEQLYMFITNLYGGPVPEDFFISPPIDTELPLEVAGAKFRNDMRLFLEEIYRIIVQLHGIGSSGHDAFCETYERIQRKAAKLMFDLESKITIPSRLLTPRDYSSYPYPQLLRPDHGTPVHDITRVQNIGHLIKRSFHPFFLKFMADNCLFDIPELIAMLQTLSPQEIMTYYDEPKYQFKSEEEILGELQYLLDNYHITPAYAITQGTGDILERTAGLIRYKGGRQAPSLNLFMVSSAHKQEPFRRSIELTPSTWATASWLQLAANSLVIAAEDASAKIARKDLCFWFEPEDTTGAALSTDENIQKAWGETSEGKRIKELLTHEHFTGTTPKVSSGGLAETVSALSEVIFNNQVHTVKISTQA